MAEAVRFFFDQHIPGAVATGLRRHGLDVPTAQAANCCGATDREQLAFTTADGPARASGSTAARTAGALRAAPSYRGGGTRVNIS